MNDYEYRAFLNLLMCSDPWPCDKQSERKMMDFADREAFKRGFDSWIVAYHEFEPKVTA